MNAPLVEQIADAVLYEGYILYPYRPSSVKNRQRWTFGGVAPRAYCEAQVAGASDTWSQRTECLVEGGDDTAIEVKLRFLHLLAREVGELAHPLPALTNGAEPPSRSVEALTVGGRTYRTWQEAVEREVVTPALRVDELTTRPHRCPFAFPAGRTWEPLRAGAGEVVGVIVRRQAPLAGALEVAAEAVTAGEGERLLKVTVRVTNETPFTPDALADRGARDAALLHSFVSTHTVLGVRGGAFVSLLDPPTRLAALAAGCANAGTWPVLVGEEGQRDTILSSPIILYDYPEIAPESPGDLFDGTEIDEILTLRILALTDDEKDEMRQIDERARALLERTENLSGDDLLRLHGAMRSIRPREGVGPGNAG